MGTVVKHLSNLVNTIVSDKDYMELIGLDPTKEAIPMGIKAVNPKVKEVRKPQCPTHRGVMVFNTALGRWMCPESGCKFTAKRREDPLDESTPAQSAPTARPVMPVKPLQQHGAKTWRLVIEMNEDDEETYWLQHSQVSFAMDVTDYVETVVDDQTNSVSLVLLFNDVQRT